MKNITKIATGVLAGAVVGATLGLLFAPKKGSKTRTLIANKAREVGSTANSGYQKVMDRLNTPIKKGEIAVN